MVFMRQDNLPKVVQLLVVVLVLLAAGSLALAASGGATAQVNSDLVWASGAGASGSGNATVMYYTDDIQVESSTDTPIEFGPETDRRLRIENVDTGKQISLTPASTEATTAVTEFELDASDINKGENTTTIELDHENGTHTFDYEVTVDGSYEAVTAQTFNRFRVAVTDAEGNVLAETDESRIRGVEYETRVEYNGSAIGISRDSGVQSDWYVELEQDVDGDDSDERVLVFDHSNGDEFFVGDTSDTQFDPEKRFSVNIYPDSEQVLNERISSLAGLQITENTRVDGPVGADDGMDDGGDGGSGADGGDGADDDSGNNTASIVREDTVEMNGSTVTIEHGGTAAVAVDSFDPDSTEISNLSGVGQDQPGGAIWNGPQGETVEFTLTPPAGASPGDTVSFNVTTDEINRITLDVVEEPTVETPPGVRQEAAAAVADKNGDFTPSSIALAINKNAQNGNVDGVEVSPSEFALIITANSGE